MQFVPDGEPFVTDRVLPMSHEARIEGPFACPAREPPSMRVDRIACSTV
jgi:hypothetical protein